MIRETDGSFPHYPDDADPFLTRIVSLYECYGDEFGFVRFYTQYIGEDAASFISLFEGRMSLYLTDRSDLTEIESFVAFSGCSSVIYNADFSLKINSVKEINGDVLVYRKYPGKSTENITEPDIEAIYDVLKSCEAEDFAVPPYLPFLSDMTHRKNKGKCTSMGIVKNDVAVSCAMAVSQTKNAVIIGAVATRPGYRRRGFSRQVVISLSEKYAAEKKAVYVFSLSEKNTRFYENSGFKKRYRFTEKQIG